MTIIALAPALAAIIWLIRRTTRAAYLDVYLFTIFLLPGWCRFMAPGAPDPTFHESAILPIAAIYLLRARSRWRFSYGDALVLLFAIQVGYSEYTNAGYNEAQNLMFDMIAGGLLPYVLAKGLIQTRDDRVAFVKRIVTLLAILSVFLAYEFRFALNPYRMIFDRFFPGQGDGWVTTFRYGFARSAGPFGHAILAGIVFLIGFHLQRWLENSRLWERPLKSRLMTAALFGNILMTMVRGPQIGAVIAAVVSAIGSGANPRKRARWVAVAIVAIGIPAGIASYSYAAVGRAAAKTASQESAAYRKELIDKYVAIAIDHAWFGWGRNGWPKVAGMPSIDNYYLLLSLMHGVPATALLLTLLAAMFARLLRNGMRAGMLKPKGSSLSFRLAGIFAGFAFAILTVYMGDNVIPIFFTLTGFAEGYLVAGGDASLQQHAPVAPAVPKPRFAVVLA
jgi:hypothetical protein